MCTLIIHSSDAHVFHCVFSSCCFSFQTFSHTLHHTRRRCPGNSDGNHIWPVPASASSSSWWPPGPGPGPPCPPSPPPWRTCYPTQSGSCWGQGPRPGGWEWSGHCTRTRPEHGWIARKIWCQQSKRIIDKPDKSSSTFLCCKLIYLWSDNSEKLTNSFPC